MNKQRVFGAFGEYLKIGFAPFAFMEVDIVSKPLLIPHLRYHSASKEQVESLQFTAIYHGFVVGSISVRCGIGILLDAKSRQG